MSLHILSSRGFTPVLVALALVISACGEPSDPPSDAERARILGDAEIVFVEEKVDFTDEQYDFTGPTSIQALKSIIPPNEFVWYGTSPGDPPPFEEEANGVYKCGSRNQIREVSQLPATIEGIITLQPRYFQRTVYCDSDERFYGSYFIEDSTGGIMVLKESRIEDFYMGDRVRLRVRGLVKYFDTVAVLVSDEEEVVSEDNPIYYRNTSRELEEEDAYEVHRIRKKVASLPTNQNFNEMCLIDVDNPDLDSCRKPCAFNNDCESGTCDFGNSQNAVAGYCTTDEGEWLVSLDREIGQRQPRKINRGDILEVTGPVVNSFGLKILVSRAGQMRFVE
jgi:hypothetical protein